MGNRTVELPELICNVCNDEPAVGVAAMPGVPGSFAYGRKCLDANAHPYGIVVANTAMLGLYEEPGEIDWRKGVADWWIQLVEDTLRHLGKTEEQFKADVKEAYSEMADMEGVDW